MGNIYIVRVKYFGKSVQGVRVHANMWVKIQILSKVEVEKLEGEKSGRCGSLA